MMNKEELQIGQTQEINLLMRKKQKIPHSKQTGNIEVSFHRQNNQLSAQQNRLNVQILRVHTIEKQRMVQSIFQMTQQTLCEFFSSYQFFPYLTTINIKQLLQCSNLKLIKNEDKIYFGQVDKKKRHGHGVNISKDGKIYQGDFTNNQKYGSGVQIYPNGNLYLGQFQNGKKHGNGNFFWFNLSSKNPKADQFVEYYDGQWWGGLPDGAGVHQRINGDLYTGNFKNGLKHGQGCEYFSNGEQYKGEYVNGLPEGYGQYFWKDGSYYKGDFKQGLRNGYGVWGLNEKSHQTYKGHYCMDKKSGYGVYQWENGWTYKGNFDNDLRTGFGELYEGNKLVYRGYWKNGEQTDDQPKNQNRIDHSPSKTFTKTSSQIYNRKTGSAQKLTRNDDFGIHFNPQERFQKNKRNQSATKRKGEFQNPNDLGPIVYKDEFILKKRPQSFNNTSRSGNPKRSATTERNTAKSQHRFTHDLINQRESRTNFTSREMNGRTMLGNGFGSTIGSSISRPIMRNSNIGNLYVPNCGRQENWRGDQRYC